MAAGMTVQGQPLMRSEAKPVKEGDDIDWSVLKNRLEVMIYYPRTTVNVC